jgi:HSP90 family molecular chaperone
VVKTEYEDVWDWRTENENKPIWTRSPKEVPAEQYNEFFKQTFSEFLDPISHVHFNVEVSSLALPFFKESFLGLDLMRLERGRRNRSWGEP